MLESWSPVSRSRTLQLLGAVAALALAAVLVGIDDSPVGISLVMLTGVCLVLVFVHPWRASARFRKLAYASVVGFVALLALGIALEAVAELAGMPEAVGPLLGPVGTAFLLGAAFLCIPALLVGIVGGVLSRSRERGRPLSRG